jgi:pimeloyl-ACP methyl ester carboxylesterase
MSACRDCFVVFLATVVAAMVSLSDTAQANADVSPATISAATPGTIFRIWPLEGGVRQGYKGYRVLYRSTDFNDRPVAVSGAILFPAEGGGVRDVVAWAHPTSGVASKCAPTLMPDLAGTIQGIDELTDKGYVIVATDYVGLGTSDHHPYLVGVSEARSVLDSVRAARTLKDVHASNRFVVWGHSQGGHAALFTGALATSYAPDLKLIGVAAAAPATNLVELFKADRATVSGRSLTSMVVLSWSRVFGFPIDDLIEKHARSHFETLANDCIESISDFLKESQDEKALEHEFLKVDPVVYPPLRAIMEANTPPVLAARTPVFVAQGTADDLVRPRITHDYVSQLCGGGARVTMHVMQGVGHMTAARDSAYAAVEWMSRLFEHHAAPSTC